MGTTTKEPESKTAPAPVPAPAPAPTLTPATDSPQPGEWNPTLTEEFLDATIFQQLLDMDDDDDREFSKGIVWNYFDQVKGSFEPIEDGMFVSRHYLADIPVKNEISINCPHSVIFSRDPLLQWVSSNSRPHAKRFKITATN